MACAPLKAATPAQPSTSCSGQLLVIQVRITGWGSVNLGAGQSWAELMDVGLSGQGDKAVAVVCGRSGFQNSQCPTIPCPIALAVSCYPSVACLT